jgi:hypothetical protein
MNCVNKHIRFRKYNYIEEVDKVEIDKKKFIYIYKICKRANTKPRRHIHFYMSLKI